MNEPVDPDEFAFLYTVAMQTSIADDDEALDALFDRVKDRYPNDPVQTESFRARFTACMNVFGSREFRKRFPENDRRIDPVVIRLAASFPLSDEGEFCETAFLDSVAANLQ